MIAKEVMVLFIEEQKCEHVANNDDKWVVDLIASHHIIPMKGLCTMYKAREFGTMKITSSYSKILGISVVRIKTNAGSTIRLKDVWHVLNLRMNVLSTLAMDREGYCNLLGSERWKLIKSTLVVAKTHACCGMHWTHVKA